MPPKKPERTVQFEAHAAARIRFEREHQGWSLEQLASRITELGCPLDRSAIYKIEQGNRRITLDEAGAFALAFRTSVDKLMVPTAVVATERGRKLWDAYQKATETYLAARSSLDELEQRLVALIDGEHGEDVLATLRASGQGYDVDSTIFVARQYQEGVRDMERRRKGAQG